MLNRLKLAFARKQLETAIKHERMLRDSLEHLHSNVLPKLENRIETLEFNLMLDKYLSENEK